MLEIKIERLSDGAIKPTKAYKFDAGWDFYAPTDMEPVVLWPSSRVIIKTGIALEIPSGWYMQIMSRSGMASKMIDARAGVIDCTYRGEIGVMLHNDSDMTDRVINPGDKIAQGIFLPVPDVKWIEVDELSGTERANGGYGSTGR